MVHPSANVCCGIRQRISRHLWNWRFDYSELLPLWSLNLNDIRINGIRRLLDWRPALSSNCSSRSDRRQITPSSRRSALPITRRHGFGKQKLAEQIKFESIKSSVRICPIHPSSKWNLECTCCDHKWKIQSFSDFWPCLLAESGE